jgi:hypothetical protein
MPFIFSTTLLFHKLDTLLLKQKNLPVVDITGFFLRTSAFTCVLMRKRNPLYPIQAASFVSIVLYLFNNNVSNLWNNSVVEKINGMAFNPTTTLKLIYWFIYHQSIVHFYTPMYLWTWYILLIAIVKYNTVIYKNNVIIILNKFKKNINLITYIVLLSIKCLHTYVCINITTYLS